jgi:hypothetical protein
MLAWVAAIFKANAGVSFTDTKVFADTNVQLQSICASGLIAPSGA